MNKHTQYNSVEAAKLLLALAFQKNQVLNVTKVQKLLYIIYSYYISKKDIQIIDETPKAWPYGPVFPRTRNKVNFSKLYKIDDPEIKHIIQDKELVNVMNSTIDKYAKFTASELSEWSHTEGSPWDLATKHSSFKWNDAIPDYYIKDYFFDVNIL